jgi:cell division septum initiation protein DivIVA
MPTMTKTQLLEENAKLREALERGRNAYRELRSELAAAQAAAKATKPRSGWQPSAQRIALRKQYDELRAANPGKRYVIRGSEIVQY